MDAQQTSASRTCLSPKPLKKGCRDFVFLHDVGMLGIARGRHDTHANQNEDFPGHAGVVIGYMRNVDSTHAVGGSFEFDYGLAGRMSFKAHYRTWLSSGSSFDAAAGPLVAEVFQAGNGGDERVKAFGVTADIAWILPWHFGPTAGLDVAHAPGRETFGVHAGLRLESGWAVAAAAAAGALYVLYALSPAHSLSGNGFSFYSRRPNGG